MTGGDRIKEHFNRTTISARALAVALALLLAGCGGGSDAGPDTDAIRHRSV